MVLLAARTLERATTFLQLLQRADTTSMAISYIYAQDHECVHAVRRAARCCIPTEARAFSDHISLMSSVSCVTPGALWSTICPAAVQVKFAVIQSYSSYTAPWPSGMHPSRASRHARGHDAWKWYVLALSEHGGALRA